MKLVVLNVGARVSGSYLLVSYIPSLVVQVAALLAVAGETAAAVQVVN
jgi:hypothetical protein